jgi:type II secretory pathway predicted ATPase ExeA
MPRMLRLRSASSLPRPATIDAGVYETDHHAQVLRDVRAAILGGRLVALPAVIGSGKTILSRRLRANLTHAN